MIRTQYDKLFNNQVAFKFLLILYFKFYFIALMEKFNAIKYTNQLIKHDY